jgi:hypothetical protein
LYLPLLPFPSLPSLPRPSPSPCCGPARASPDAPSAIDDRRAHGSRSAAAAKLCRLDRSTEGSAAQIQNFWIPEGGGSREGWRAGEVSARAGYGRLRPTAAGSGRVRSAEVSKCGVGPYRRDWLAGWQSGPSFPNPGPLFSARPACHAPLRGCSSQRDGRDICGLGGFGVGSACHSGA